MIKSDIIGFLAAYGITEYTDSGEWIRCSCPMARWTHSGGTDKKPSFGIKINTTGLSAWHCFSEGTSGDLVSLYWNLYRLSGGHNLKAHAYLCAELAEQVDLSESTIPALGVVLPNKFKDMIVKPINTYRTVPDSVLRAYPLLGSKSGGKGEIEILKWLRYERRISGTVIKKFKLRMIEDPPSVVFPIITPDGRVVDLRVRAIHDKKIYRLSPKITGSEVDYRAPELWFGQQFVDRKTPLLLVEGELDALRVCSLGTWNVLASCGTPAWSQFKTIYHDNVWLGFDSDRAGDRDTQLALKALKSRVKAIVRWGRADIKDAGDLVDRKQFMLVLREREIMLTNTPSTL